MENVALSEAGLTELETDFFDSREINELFLLHFPSANN